MLRGDRIKCHIRLDRKAKLDPFDLNGDVSGWRAWWFAGIVAGRQRGDQAAVTAFCRRELGGCVAGFDVRLESEEIGHGAFPHVAV